MYDILHMFRVETNEAPSPGLDIVMVKHFQWSVCVAMLFEGRLVLVICWRLRVFTYFYEHFLVKNIVVNAGVSVIRNSWYHFVPLMIKNYPLKFLKLVKFSNQIS